MELKFKSLSLFEFRERFPDSDSCIKHLADLKWAEGFKCDRCGHGNYCGGGTPHSRQCTSCRYDESPTANTLFHKMKFDPLKAFYIVYFVATNKKGITSTELSRKLGLRQKTCWGFKRKVMKAMKSSGNFPISGEGRSSAVRKRASGAVRTRTRDWWWSVSKRRKRVCRGSMQG